MLTLHLCAVVGRRQPQKVPLPLPVPAAVRPRQPLRFPRWSLEGYRLVRRRAWCGGIFCLFVFCLFFVCGGIVWVGGPPLPPPPLPLTPPTRHTTGLALIVHCCCCKVLLFCKEKHTAARRCQHACSSPGVGVDLHGCAYAAVHCSPLALHRQTHKRPVLDGFGAGHNPICPNYAGEHAIGRGGRRSSLCALCMLCTSDCTHNTGAAPAFTVWTQ